MGKSTLSTENPYRDTYQIDITPEHQVAVIRTESNEQVALYTPAASGNILSLIEKGKRHLSDDHKAPEVVFHKDGAIVGLININEAKGKETGMVVDITGNMLTSRSQLHNASYRELWLEHTDPYMFPSDGLLRPYSYIHPKTHQESLHYTDASGFVCNPSGERVRVSGKQVKPADLRNAANPERQTKHRETRQENAADTHEMPAHEEKLQPPADATVIHYSPEMAEEEKEAQPDTRMRPKMISNKQGIMIGYWDRNTDRVHMFTDDTVHAPGSKWYEKVMRALRRQQAQGDSMPDL